MKPTGAEGAPGSAPVAAIDCGTNSIRLLIARREEGTGVLIDLERHLEMVRLGLDVDRTGRFDPVAIERTLDAARRYQQLIEHHGVAPSDVRFVATSATRDASNRDDFIEGIREILGVTPEVITGDEEAALSFRGAVSTVGDLPEGPRLVVDIGGGSTELVLGTETPSHRISMNIGSVRLTERHLATDPPTAAEVAAATADVDALLDQAAAVVPLEQASALVGVAGTVTTVTGVALGLEEYRPDVTHGARLRIEEVERLCRDLLSQTREQRASHRLIHPGRIDVIGAGALIWSRIMQRVAAASGITDTRTSEHDILDGIALDLLDRVA
nr:Ppx/GppA phosphatase family protein [Brachybacterium sp. FME24]